MGRGLMVMEVIGVCPLRETMVELRIERASRQAGRQTGRQGKEAPAGHPHTHPHTQARQPPGPTAPHCSRACVDFWRGTVAVPLLPAHIVVATSPRAALIAAPRPMALPPLLTAGEQKWA